MIGRLDGSNGEDVAAATLDAAWQAGVRYFDTAPLYGLGRSERRLGRFLQTKPRAAFTISTKVGRLVQDTGSCEPGFDFDYGRDGALRSLEASLRRLGLDRIDIALVHDIDRWTHGEAQPDRMREALDGALPALAGPAGAGRRRCRGPRRQRLAGLPRGGAARRCRLLPARRAPHPAGPGSGRRTPAALPRARDRRHHRRPVQHRHPGDRLRRAGHLQLRAGTGRHHRTRAADRGRSGPPRRAAGGRRAQLSPARPRGRDGDSRPGVAGGGRRRRGPCRAARSRARSGPTCARKDCCGERPSRCHRGRAPDRRAACSPHG